MPVIKALPSPEIIKGLRGALDFYCWKGLNCVRSWPRYRPTNRTPKSIAAALLFGAIIQGYALLGGALKTLLSQDATDQPRTPRDLYISGVLGHLHEASMSDFLDLLTRATDYLQTLETLVNALNTTGTDELRVLAGYDGANWQPLLLDASRRAQVRGQDQLFTYKEAYHERATHVKTGAGNYDMYLTQVPADEIWKITNIAAFSRTGQCASFSPGLYHNTTFTYLYSERNPAAWVMVPGHCEAWLDPTDRLRVEWTACADGEVLECIAIGHKMTLET